MNIAFRIFFTNSFFFSMIPSKNFTEIHGVFQQIFFRNRLRDSFREQIPPDEKKENPVFIASEILERVFSEIPLEILFLLM